jgi:hypothetical protein
MSISPKLLSTFYRAGNCKIKGFLSTPPVGASTPTLQFRLLQVPFPCLLNTGDVVWTKDNVKFLLMETTQNLPGARTFKAAQVAEEYLWSRTSKVKDPVAGVMRDTGMEHLGIVHAYFENPTEVTMEKMAENRYTFYTGEEVKVGDLVGGKSVKRVADVAGVKLVFAE